MSLAVRNISITVVLQGISFTKTNQTIFIKFIKLLIKYYSHGGVVKDSMFL